MSTLVIADVHGNLPALEAVLAHPAAQKCTEIISLGDHVNFGPQSREVHDRLTALGAILLLGNHEERLLRPALEKLLPVMAISCWGYVPEDLEIVFEPVMTSSPAERAELVQKMSQDVIEGYKAGLLTREQALAELKSRGEELGVSNCRAVGVTKKL